MGVRRDVGGMAYREIVEARVKYFEVLNQQKIHWRQ